MDKEQYGALSFIIGTILTSFGNYILFAFALPVAILSANILEARNWLRGLGTVID